jgi:hypothetical protein
VNALVLAVGSVVCCLYGQTIEQLYQYWTSTQVGMQFLFSSSGARAGQMYTKRRGAVELAVELRQGSDDVSSGARAVTARVRRRVEWRTSCYGKGQTTYGPKR